jgi:hypothetical protein
VAEGLQAELIFRRKQWLRFDDRPSSADTRNPIHGQQYIEFRCFCLFQKFRVLKFCEPGVPSGLVIAPWEVMPQLLVYTLIK